MGDTIVEMFHSSNVIHVGANDAYVTSGSLLPGTKHEKRETTPRIADKSSKNIGTIATDGLPPSSTFPGWIGSYSSMSAIPILYEMSHDSAVIPLR